MREKLLIGFLGLTLLLAGLAAVTLHRLSESGEDVLLRLRPVDPRSFLLGDYMDLRYELGPDLTHAYRVRHGNTRQLRANGLAVVRLDADRIAHFVRLEDGSPLATDERLLRFRIRSGNGLPASGKFFFQEGLEPVYATASYGILRLRPDGSGMLVGLADDTGQVITAEKPDTAP